MTDEPTRAERMLAKVPVPEYVIKAARAVKAHALVGTDEHRLCENRLAELEERAPRHIMRI